MRVILINVGDVKEALYASNVQKGVRWHTHCRSEPAREKLTDNATCLMRRVIVDVIREQARSYRERISGMGGGKLQTQKTPVFRPGSLLSTRISQWLSS
ncbi:hypothetical protein ACF6ZU_22455 [Pseudomonas migulae]|uniref:hypothetical protein n=1 Tax=Pseudomonas migulae TaxID=78543 RepID=UPI00371B11BB